MRQVAGDWSISTKYVSRIVARTLSFAAPTFSCSGCGYGFSTQGALASHQDVWTSGNTHELVCMVLVSA